MISIVHGQKGKKMSEKRTKNARKTHACDLIDRKLALWAIYRLGGGERNVKLAAETGPALNPYDDGIYSAAKEIERMPAAEPKTGKWIDTGSGQECDQCHEIQYGYDTGRNYCANCGAKMEE